MHSTGNKRRKGNCRVKSMENECYYTILSVTRDATPSDIKKAYRKKALKYHPDKNRSDPDYAAEMFKLVAEAFQVLSDPEKKQIYDRYGRDAIRNGLRGSSSDGMDFEGFNYSFSNAADLFEQFFANDPFFSRHANSASCSSRSFTGFDGFMSDFHDIGSIFNLGAPGNDPFAMSGFNRSGFSGTSSSTSTSYSSGGVCKTTTTTTRTENGKKVTKTETTIKYPNGKVETSSHENCTSLGDADYSRSRKKARDRLGWH